MTEAFDLFVIGAGSAGVRAARMAAQRGARVAIADPGALGGTCVNVGCIPKKLYRYAAGYAASFAEAAGYGWTVDTPRFDWQHLKAQRAIEIGRLNGVYGDLLRSAGATLLRERATLSGSGEVTLAGERIGARHVLIATGSAPHVPPWPGAGHVLVSDAMFDLPELPRRLVVLGGGYIGCEFASIFAALGVQVTLCLRGPQVLRGFDDDLRDFVGDALVAQGITLHTGARVACIEAGADGVRRVVMEDGRGCEADVVLAATGRAPRTAGLGLAEAGVVLEASGAVRVDAGLQTSVPTVHAAGDVVGRLPLTPVALAEAMHIVARLFGGTPQPLDYTQIPTAVFTHPELAAVGLTEAVARQRHGEVRIYRSAFRPLRHTLSGQSDRSLMKLVVDAASDRVLGVHMAGDDAAEVLQGFAAALVAGVTKAQLDATIGIHPTAAEEFVTMRTPVA